MMSLRTTMTGAFLLARDALPETELVETSRSRHVLVIGKHQSVYDKTNK